jgi:hypothetical protein
MSNQTFLKIGLPEYLREELEKEAAESGMSLGAVIRDKIETARGNRRLYGDKTHFLGEAVKSLARTQARATGVSWHEHPAAEKALLAALEDFLTFYSPKEARCEYPYDPKTVGLITARNLLEILTAFDKQAAGADGELWKEGQAMGKEGR